MTKHHNKSNNLPRPMIHLSDASRSYPNAWKLSEAFRRDKGVDPLPDWPDWCLLPTNAWYSIISDSVGDGPLRSHLAKDVGRLAALGAWRMTKGIYKYHPEILRALTKTSIKGKLPSELFFRLPQWCVYIETPNFYWFNDKLHGFFAHIDKDVIDGHVELRLLMDTEKALTPFFLYIGDWTVLEGVEKALSSGLLAKAELSEATADLVDPVNEITAMMQPLLSLVIYLCSKSPEYKGGKAPYRPRAKRTKKGWRFFAVSAPKIWTLGENTGKELEAAKKQDGVKRLDGERRRPRYHIRGFHWHSYWTGPKDGIRRLEVRWMSPIPVNVDLRAATPPKLPRGPSKGVRP